MLHDLPVAADDMNNDRNDSSSAFLLESHGFMQNEMDAESAVVGGYLKVAPDSYKDSDISTSDGHVLRALLQQQRHNLEDSSQHVPLSIASRQSFSSSKFSTSTWLSRYCWVSVFSS